MDLKELENKLQNSEILTSEENDFLFKSKMGYKNQNKGVTPLKELNNLKVTSKNGEN